MYENSRLLLTFCLEENSILVNEAIVRTLNFPKQIQMLINVEKHTLLIRACDVDDVSAIVIPPMSLPQFEVSAKTLLKQLRKITGWSDSKPRAVLGEYIPQCNAVIFYLDEAEIVQLQTLPNRR